jgi:AraC-like DNA-binding protein
MKKRIAPHRPPARHMSLHDVQIWQLDGVGEIIRGPVPEPMPKVVHQDFLIGVMESGIVKATYRGARHTLQNRALILGQPGEGAAFEPVVNRDEGYPMRVCMRCPSFLLQSTAEAIVDRRTAAPFFAGFVTPDRHLTALFLRFQRTLAAGASDLETSSRFHDVLEWIVRRHASPPPRERRIKRERDLVRYVREYLHDHYADNLNLDELALMVNLSPFHLNRVFRTDVGLPPHAYQTQLRVTRGKALLAQGIAIQQAAVDVGFFDQSHFTNHFRRLLGFTPGTYQRIALGRRFGRLPRPE